jgi:hypothetical protein
VRLADGDSGHRSGSCGTTTPGRFRLLPTCPWVLASHRRARNVRDLPRSCGGIAATEGPHGWTSPLIRARQIERRISLLPASPSGVSTENRRIELGRRHTRLPERNLRRYDPRRSANAFESQQETRASPGADRTSGNISAETRNRDRYLPIQAALRSIAQRATWQSSAASRTCQTEPTSTWYCRSANGMRNEAVLSLRVVSKETQMRGHVNEKHYQAVEVSAPGMLRVVGNRGTEGTFSHFLRNERGHELNPNAKKAGCLCPA